MKLRNWDCAGLKSVHRACGVTGALVILGDTLTCAGNHCHCTGYASQMRALAKYAEGRRAK